MRAATGLAPEMTDMIVDTLREVLARHLSDETILDLDAREEFPADVVRELLSPDVGMHLLFLPEDVGGLGGGARDVCRVSEEMAAVDLGVATAFLAISLGMDPILVGGTPEQKTRWLGRIAEEGLIVAYGVTEPEAGSNVASLKATAEPVKDEAGVVTHYRLNGTKQFITNGAVADIYTILARATDGPSFFVVERDTPGLSAGKKEEKHGIRVSNTTSVILEDVLVPASHLIGGVEGQGLKQASAVFGYTRLMVGAFGLGGGRAALERAVRYARERVQFGTSLIEKEGFAFKLLVPHHIDLTAGRAYADEIATRIDQGEGSLEVEGAIAKLWSTEAGNRAADAAVQALGGYGYMREYMVEKIRRDVRITNIYEGTSEILQSIVGMHRWKEQVRSKGAFYEEMARGLERLHEAHPEVGASLVAAAARGVGLVISYCHRRRLVKHQVVLFALADLVTRVDIAGALSRKAARLEAEGHADAAVSAAMARVFARQAVDRVCDDGHLCATGFTQPAADADVQASRPMEELLEGAYRLKGMPGLWLDMETVAEHLRRA